MPVYIYDYPKSESESKTWDTDYKPVKECPYLKAKKKIWIDMYVYILCKKLSEKMGSKEWLIYAKAEEIGDIIIVREPTIPKQKVSTSSVEVKEPANGYNAVIHSHHDMGLHSFSGTDDSYINSNNMVSILWTNDKGFTKAVAKIKLPCGHDGIVEAEIQGLLWDRTSIKELEEKAKEQIEAEGGNIEEETYSYYYGPYYGRKNYGYYDYHGHYLDVEEDVKDEDKEEEEWLKRWNGARDNLFE